VISVALARRLRDGGLRWTPAPGDRFVVADRGMDDDIFTLAEMTTELHKHPSGTVIGFNGTVEWALDSVFADEAVWLPSEAQLRELLRATFRSLTRAPDGGWTVTVEVSALARTFTEADAAEAYGLALLHLVTGD
jgi:hypothetical protein